MRSTPRISEAYIEYVRVAPENIVIIVEECLKLTNQIEVVGNGYIIDSPREVDEYKYLTGEQFSSLTIKSVSPTFEIQFSSDGQGTRLYVVNDDPFSDWFFKIVKSMLESHRSNMSQFVQEPLGTMALLISVAFLVVAIVNGPFSTSFLILGSLQIVALALVFLHRMISVKGALCRDEKKHLSDFIKENKTRIILLLIGAVIVTIVAKLFDFLLGLL